MTVMVLELTVAQIMEGCDDDDDDGGRRRRRRRRRADGVPAADDINDEDDDEDDNDDDYDDVKWAVNEQLSLSTRKSPYLPHLPIKYTVDIVWHGGQTVGCFESNSQ
nr:unnamed protein product [Spirometra erinaceieuropaei]